MRFARAVTHHGCVPRVAIVFPKPGFFLTDVRVEVRLDGETIYDGGFMEGFRAETDAAPGTHRVETFIHLGLMARKKMYRLAVGNRPVEAVLQYSRIWGNFKNELRTG